MKPIVNLEDINGQQFTTKIYPIGSFSWARLWKCNVCNGEFFEVNENKIKVMSEPDYSHHHLLEFQLWVVFIHLTDFKIWKAAYYEN